MPDIDPKALRAIASSTEAAAKTVSGQSAANAGLVAGSVGKLTESFTKLSAIQAVDLLTDEEVHELELLANPFNDARRIADERSKDPAVAGMYRQLNDLGFIVGANTIDDRFVFVALDRKANWAIERHRKKVAKERERERKEALAKRIDWGLALLTVFLGWLLGLFSAPVSQIIWSALL